MHLRTTHWTRWLKPCRDVSSWNKNHLHTAIVLVSCFHTRSLMLCIDDLLYLCQKMACATWNLSMNRVKLPNLASPSLRSSVQPEQGGCCLSNAHTSCVCCSRKMLANQEDTLWVLSMEGCRKWLCTHIYTNPIAQEPLCFPCNSVLLEKGWKLHNSWMSDSKVVSILCSQSSSHCIAPSNWCLCSQILFVLETSLLQHTYPPEMLQYHNSAMLSLWLIQLHSVLAPLVSTEPVTVCETANERWNCQENCLESLIKWGEREKKKNKAKIILSLRNRSRLCRKQAVPPEQCLLWRTGRGLADFCKHCNYRLAALNLCVLSGDFLCCVWFFTALPTSFLFPSSVAYVIFMFSPSFPYNEDNRKAVCRGRV